MKLLAHTMLGVSLLFAACNKTEHKPHTNTPAASTATTAEAEQLASDLFLKWNTALQSQDPKKVVALYTEDALLIPTASNDVRSGRDEIENYFAYFLMIKPSGHVIERHVRFLTPNKMVSNGVYVFSLQREDVKEEIVARYTFLYQKIDDQWYILNHHSSAMPNPVSPDSVSKAG